MRQLGHGNLLGTDLRLRSALIIFLAHKVEHSKNKILLQRGNRRDRPLTSLKNYGV
ncbi:hypothetical protein SAMCCGM7_Ch0879 [Sinorhizobium americanum CCGM7]|nr:hypothetical protein SAMCCGM7_Ch0879 [Sinorhizobium americanum CCGM7]